MFGTFPRFVSFECATFVEDSNFAFAKFYGGVLLGRVIFDARVTFEQCTFNGFCMFSSAVFASDANFEQATFTCEAYFTAGTSFNSVSNFSAAEFYKLADFSNTQFGTFTSFKDATFHADAEFQSVSFANIAYFENAIFHNNARFNSTQFFSDALFQGVTIARYANFDEVEFYGSLNLTYCSFGIIASFVGIILRGHVQLSWPGEGHKYSSRKNSEKIERGRLLFKNVIFNSEFKNDDKVVLDIRNCPLQKDSTIRIHDCNMSRILLARTDCREIEFQGVEWPMLKRRRVIGDEYIWRTMPETASKLDEKRGTTKFGWNDIQQTYQQLAKRHREDLNHPVANDFERGIFIARRENAREKRKWGDFALMTLYQWISNYGGSIARPFLGLLLTFPAFAVFYYFTSVSSEVDPFWTNALSVALRVATFRAGVLQSLTENHVGVYLLVAFQIALTATLVTLFIFAVRRRFRH